jgi:hypothetical protein
MTKNFVIQFPENNHHVGSVNSLASEKKRTTIGSIDLDSISDALWFGVPVHAMVLSVE